MSKPTVRPLPLTLLLRGGLLLLMTALAGQAQSTGCPPTTPPAGRDFHGQTLTRPNFSHWDLTNANFEGATLIAPSFLGATLTGANFHNATFVGDTANPVASPDFTLANLERACFDGAQLKSPTYFAYATVTCANFSGISLDQALFGDGPLAIDRTATGCRLAFRNDTLDCQYLDDWRYLDLGGANIKACLGDLKGRDFTQAKMASVDMTGAVLDGAKFAGADLSQAKLNQASLEGVDLSNATLFGTQLNQANLTGATLYRAFLANNTGGNISQSASLRQAHLKNVNLAYAELSGVDFTYANFYGDNATAGVSCTTTLTNYQGFTSGCSTAHGATMTDTVFENAYLYGADFSGVQGKGVSFSQAVLTGAGFAEAVLTANPLSGRNTTFYRAYLQGADLGGAQLTGTDLSQAVVDFRTSGNNLFVYLDGVNHNQFACGGSGCVPAAGQDVCVEISYGRPTTVPADNATLTCPDGGGGPCGAADPSGGSVRWKSVLSPEQPPPGMSSAWYDQDATYTKAPVNSQVICKGKGDDASVLLW